MSASPLAAVERPPAVGNDEWIARAGALLDAAHRFRLLASDAAPATDPDACARGLGLYEGRAGDALVLATYASVADDRRRADAARRIVATLVANPESTAATLLARPDGLGLAFGVSGLIFTLARCGELLGERRFIAAADRYADLVDPARVVAHAEPDVLAGLAGWTLALLALARLSPKSAALDRAATCGRRLMAARQRTGEGHRAWPSGPFGRPHTGFGHGASGIAYALGRLGVVTGDRELLAAAEEAFAYERTMIVREAGNWRDLRVSLPTSGGVPVAWGWCAGAPGIVLARLALISAVDGPEIGAEIAMGLESTVLRGARTLHHLCCGTMSRVETLLVAAEHEPGATHGDTAAALANAAWVSVNRAVGAEPQTVFPGLFEGIGGVAFELLRVAAPHRVRSLLLFA